MRASMAARDCWRHRQTRAAIGAWSRLHLDRATAAPWKPTIRAIGKITNQTFAQNVTNLQNQTFEKFAHLY